MCQWAGTSLDPVMACHHTGAKPLLVWMLRHFGEIWIIIQWFSLTKMHQKMLFAKCRPFCLGCIVLKYVDDSVQDCNISIDNALEILSCTKSSIYTCRVDSCDSRACHVWSGLLVLYPLIAKIMGPTRGPMNWGRQDPGGPHVGHMNFAIWVRKLNNKSQLLRDHRFC